MISYAFYNSFKLRQLTGIPLTRICEVACEIAYESLLEDPELLRETRRKYGVRTPEKQLAIDLKRGYERVIPIDCYDLGDRELERVILWKDK